MTTRILLVASIALSASCTMTHHVDPCTEDPTRCADAGTSPDGGGHDAGADLGMPDLRGPDVYLSARIEPADATIRCDGTQSFRFFVSLVGGSEVELLPTTWASDAPTLGTVDMHGVFTPRAGCIASGRTHVTASATDAFGTTVTGTGNVAVRIELGTTLVGVATVADGDAAFAHTTATAAASPVLYPLDGAVMPNNVLPPDIQWSGGSAGDVYRVTVSNPSIALTAYVRHSGAGFGFDWTPPADLWRFVAENWDSGVDIQIDRYDSLAEHVVLGTPVRIRLTRSSIFGSVYYWGLTFPNGPGEFDRIRAGTGQRDRILQGSCVGCHTVSRDGHYLAGVVGGGSGTEPSAVYDLTADVTAIPPPTVFPPIGGGSAFFFSGAFNPTNTRLFVNTNYTRLFDPMTGARILTATGLPPEDTDHLYFGADWSPDGSTIVMTHIDASSASWGHKFSHGDLVTLPVTDPSTDTFGAVTPFHDASTLSSSPEGGRVDNYASWSPDGNWVAFQHGAWSRSSQGNGDTFNDGWSSASIYLISRDGATVQRLDTAVAGVHGSRDYFPTFSPFVSVEPDHRHYLWLAFTSGRRYGNAQVGTAGLDALAGRQIWVSAIDMGTDEIPTTLAADPSSVPYWLPGQDARLENLGAKWAPLACGEAASSCTLSSDCCSGYCAPGPGGALSCSTPPVDMCQPSGATCSEDADCCTSDTVPMVCSGHACVPRFG